MSNNFEDQLFEIFHQSQTYKNLTLSGIDSASHDMKQFRRDRLEQYKNWRKNPDAIWIVIERDGKPVAYAATDINKTFNELGVGDLCVAVEWRGKGVAKELMAKIEEKAKELGAGSIFFAVHKDNLVARKLYEKHGYTYEENKYLDMKKML